MRALLAIACLAGFISSTAEAAKIKAKGEVQLFLRGFSNDQDPRTKDLGWGIFSRLEANVRHKPFKARARVFGRLDAEDGERSIVVVEELWGQAKFWGFELRVGADLVNWTATEAFHPADIINARNLDSDVENYEKLGEPMVALSHDLFDGEITAYFMPYFSTAIAPSTQSRLSFAPPGVVVGEPLRLLSNGNFSDRNFGVQAALHATQKLGDGDLSLHVVHHMDRSQPEFVFDRQTFQVRPLFRKVTQFGGTYAHILDPIIVKLEFGYRLFANPSNNFTEFGFLPDRDHLQVAAGAEYTYLHESGVESTLLAEAQSVFFVEEAIRKSLSIFQRDALLGYRIALNDQNSTEALVSVIVDLEDPDSILFNGSIRRRVFDSWNVSAAFRMVFTPDGASTGLSIPSRSDHVRVSISRFF